MLEKIEKDFNQYLSEVFEDVVRDYIARKMNFDLVKKWWNRIGEEIDICGNKR